MNKKLSYSMNLLTLALFTASVFMLAEGNMSLGIVFPAAGSCFLCLASMIVRK